MLKSVDIYEYDELGKVIDPKSDMKDVIIPMPPIKMSIKINPRPAIIYLNNFQERDSEYEEEELDRLKEYCFENKVVLICPYKSDINSVIRTYEYVQGNKKKLNVRQDDIHIANSSDLYCSGVDAIRFIMNEKRLMQVTV